MTGHLRLGSVGLFYGLFALASFCFPVEALAVFRPGLDLHYGFLSTEAKEDSGSFVRLGSIYRASLTPSIGWASDGYDPFEFRITSKFTATRYETPMRIEEGDLAFLFGAGVEFSKEIGRAFLALGARHDQEKVPGVSPGSGLPFLRTVGVPSAMADVGIFAIGTTEKTLRFGARFNRYFSTVESQGSKIDRGLGVELYSGFDFSASYGLRLSYVMTNMKTNLGSMENSEIVIGLRILKPQSEFGRMPLDY